MLNIKKDKNGRAIIAKSTLESDTAGEVEVLDTDGAQYYHNGVTRAKVVTDSHSATLTNKEISADDNVITELEVDNLKAGVLNTDLSVPTPTDTEIPSALAVKTYVDDLITLSGVPTNSTDLGTFTGTTIPDNSTNKEAFQALETYAEQVNTDLELHIADATAAHQALAINNIPSGTISSTNIQDTVNELDTHIQAHINDTTDAHDASSISNIPSGNLAATDQQGVNNELQSDIDTRATITQLDTKITGPDSSTDMGIVVYDGETGKLAKNSGVKIFPDDSIYFVNNISSSTGVFTAPGLTATSQFREGVSSNAQSGTNILLNTPSTPINILTNAALVSIGAIDAVISGYNLTLINRTGNAITILNEELTQTANQRVLTGTGANLTLANEASILLKYDGLNSRFNVIGGSGSGSTSSGGTTDVDVMFTQTFDTAVLADFTQTGLALDVVDTMHGTASAKLTHQAGINQSFAQTVAVNTKFRGVNMTAAMLVKSTASEGNVTLTVTDVTNSATLTSQSIGTASQAIASLTTTNLSATVGGFTTANINLLSVGMSVTGSGIPAGTEITAVNAAALTVTISNNATATATVTLRFSALPKTVQLGFTIPANCASISYTITALPEAGSPETYIDDVVFKNYFLGMSNQGQSTLSVVVPNAVSSVSYTPTFTGLGTVSSASAFYSRTGEYLEGNFSVTTGTHTAVATKFSLPPGLTIDFTKVNNNAVIGNAGSNLTPFDARIVAYSSDPSSFYIVADNADISNSSLGTTWANSNTFTGSMVVPITGWTATSTQSFTSTDLVPAKAVLGNYTLTIPAVTDWVSYTPTMSHISGGITNATATGKWRRDGSDILVTGVVAFSAASAVFNGINVSLPNGYTIDTNKLNTSEIPPLGQMTIYDNGAAVYQGMARYGTSSLVYLDTSGVNTHTGSVPIIGTGMSNTFPFTFNTGDGISFEFRFPAVGLSATSEVVVSGTQAALVQQADSMVRLSGANGFGSTATTTRRFSTLVQSVGSDILYTDSATLGGLFTVQTSGIYNISYSEDSAANVNAMTVVINQNGTILAFDRQVYNTASAASKGASASWSGYLTAGDIITGVVNAAAENSGASAFFTMSRAGSLKVASVSADQKIAIPTSELRFDGSSSKGTGFSGTQVIFSTIGLIRGDAFTVINDSVGTLVTMRKAGLLIASTTLQTTGGGYVTLVAGGESQVDYSSAGNLATSTLSKFVNVGDTVYVSSNGVITGGSNSLKLSFQEQSVQVSVSNTLPQFSESDTSLRLSGANGFGSTATLVRRFASVLQNIGNDIEYTDSPTLGGQFKARTSGVYNVTFSEQSTANTAVMDVNIQLNGVSVATDNQTYTPASVAAKSASVSWSGYLTAGDIITALIGVPANNNGTFCFFTMSKVGKPNVTGVNVTPFIQIPQPLVQSSFLQSSASFSNSNISGALTSNTNNGIYSYNSSNGIYTALKAATVTMSVSAVSSGTNLVQALVIKSGTIIAQGANDGGIVTTGGSSTASFQVMPGDTFNGYIDVGPSNNQRVTVTATAQADQILTAPETFSTDTAPLVYAGSSQYDISTLSTAPVGTFITFTYGAGGNVRTQTNAAPPTQSPTDMNANGMLIYTRAYSANSSAAQPSVIAVQIGKGMKGVTKDLYKSATKVNVGSLESVILTASLERGMMFRDYNESTGVIILDAGATQLNTNTSHDFIFSDTSGQGFGYLVVNASKNPALTGMGIPTIAARGVSTSGQSISSSTPTSVVLDAAKTFDTHGALNTATGTFTAPETGYYQVSAGVGFALAVGAVNADYDVVIHKNGSLYVVFASYAETTATTIRVAHGSDIVFLNKNDTLTYLAYQATGSTRTLTTVGNLNYFSIIKVNL